MGLDAYIYEAVRTPRGAGKVGGALADLRPIELVSHLLRALDSRIDDIRTHAKNVVLGCSSQVGDQGANLARTAILYAGWPETLSGGMVSRFCASGFDAVHRAALEVHANVSDCVIAGGVEMLSRVSMLADKGAWFSDPIVRDRTKFVPMITAADAMAKLSGIDRSALDALAVESHARAACATRKGAFSRTMVPIETTSGALLDRDELIREGLSAEQVSKLAALREKDPQPWADAVVRRAYPELTEVPPAHTIAASPGLADAAALLVIGNARLGETLNRRPLARIVGFRDLAVEPVQMLHGPAVATRALLDSEGLDARSIDVYECNESFAATVLRFCRDLELDPESVNRWGGAMAMGHPLGATGPILLATAADRLLASGGSHAIATICAGAGVATATLLSRDGC